MIIKQLYIADDGTEFEDEEECVKYEQEKEAFGIRGMAFLLTEDYKLLPLLPKSLEDAWFIVIEDTEAIPLLIEWSKQYGIYHPWDRYSRLPHHPGIYFFRADGEQWYHLGDTIAELKLMRGKVSEAVEQLEK